MIFSKSKPIISVIVFLIIFILLLINNVHGIQPAKTTRSIYGDEDLRITEHRISIVQDEQTNSFTVYDEFWITNGGLEPYFNFVYNSLPEDIAIEEGMFCQISENGEHTCFDWQHKNNNYFWEGHYNILPKNYATDFKLKVQATSIENITNSITINRTVNSDSLTVEKLIETDTWNWVRDGFYHGWRTFINFTIKNPNNLTESFDLEVLDFPEGVRLELVEDTNANSILDTPDLLMAFDSNFDGTWESVPDFDSNNNSKPDITLKAYENKSFLVYLRADYTLHFLTEYKKQIEPSDDGIFEFNKKTIYDTSLMRIYIIPDKDTSILPTEISFQKRMSEDTLFYYGEWSGDRDNEIKVYLEDLKEKVNTNKQNDPRGQILSISVILILIILLLAIIGFRASKKKGKRNGVKN